MSKAFGAVGGFVVGKSELIDFLRVQTPTYIFSSALPPATSAGIIESIHQIQTTPSLRERLMKNAELLKTSLKDRQFNVLNSSTHIVPVVVGDDNKAKECSLELLRNGVYCPAMRWPAMPLGKSILRCIPNSAHSESQIKTAVDILTRVGKTFRLIPN